MHYVFDLGWGGNFKNICPHCSAWTGLMQIGRNNSRETDGPFFHLDVLITQEVAHYTRSTLSAMWQIDLNEPATGA